MGRRWIAASSRMASLCPRAREQEKNTKCEKKCIMPAFVVCFGSCNRYLGCYGQFEPPRAVRECCSRLGPKLTPFFHAVSRRAPALPREPLQLQPIPPAAVFELSLSKTRRQGESVKRQCRVGGCSEESGMAVWVEARGCTGRACGTVTS